MAPCLFLLAVVAAAGPLAAASYPPFPCVNGTPHMLPNGAMDNTTITFDNCAYETAAASVAAANTASIAALTTTVTTNHANLTTAIDITYYFICGGMVFLMQLGFAMLEVGCVNQKNINNIILKGVLDICISALSFWAFGFAIAFGSHKTGSFIGGKHYWFGDCLDQQPGCDADASKTYHEFFFQFAFAATAATIVSGAVAERTTTLCYVMYSIVLTAFVYPIVVHWQWSSGMTGASKDDGGWGAVDYAGSGVVHMTGGLAAIVGAAIIGPRQGRYADGSKPFSVTVNKMPAYSVVFQTLGTLILWFGWYGFNTGSTLGIVWVAEEASPASSEAGLVMINTTLAPAAAGVTAMLFAAALSMMKGDGFTLQLEPVLNGILAGLVSITAGCGDVRPWAAVVMGIIGGMIYTATSLLQVHLMIDDVVDAGPVHFWCGIWGVLGLGFFADDVGTGLTGDMKGIFYGGGELFANNLAFVAMIIVWVGPLMAILFLGLKLSGLGRVSGEVETIGLDVSKHGVKAATVEKTPPVFVVPAPKDTKEKTPDTPEV